MDDPLTEEQLLKRARRRVGMKMGWLIHALVFVLVNGGLFLINQWSGHPRWANWPLMGWGLGLVIHGIVVWVSLSGEGLRERMLAKEVERLRRKG